MTPPTPPTLPTPPTPPTPPPIPPALVDPPGVWVFDWVIPIAGSLVIALAVADSVRRRRPTWGLLFLVNSMAVCWMETVGDWGQDLVYSPAFAVHHLLGWLPLKTPNDPVFIPFAYAVYWTVHALAILWLGQLLVDRYGWSMLKAIAVLAVPVNYTWDLLVEGTATAMGWWTYDPGIGPVLTWPSGGKITLLWTVGLMCGWPNVIAYWAGKPPVRGLNHIERFCGLGRLTAAGPGAELTVPRWRFELARFGAWFAVFQVSFFVMLIVPLVGMRLLLGHHSPYAP